MCTSKMNTLDKIAQHNSSSGIKIVVIDDYMRVTGTPSLNDEIGDIPELKGKRLTAPVG